MGLNPNVHHKLVDRIANRSGQNTGSKIKKDRVWDKRSDHVAWLWKMLDRGFDPPEGVKAPDGDNSWHVGTTTTGCDDTIIRNIRDGSDGMYAELKSALSTIEKLFDRIDNDVCENSLPFEIAFQDDRKGQRPRRVDDGDTPSINFRKDDLPEGESDKPVERRATLRVSNLTGKNLYFSPPVLVSGTNKQKDVYAFDARFTEPKKIEPEKKKNKNNKKKSVAIGEIVLRLGKDRKAGRALKGHLTLDYTDAKGRMTRFLLNLHSDIQPGLELKNDVPELLYRQAQGDNCWY